MVYGVPQPTRSFFAIHSAPHLIHFKADCEGFFEVFVFWVYVGLVFFCFFKTDKTVFMLTPRVRAVSRMPLPFSAIFIIICLVCGRVPLFLY